MVQPPVPALTDRQLLLAALLCAALATQAEGAMFFRTIAPFIARVDPAGAKTIQQVLSVGAPLPRGGALAIVKPILERNYARLGISRANVGTFGAKQNLAC